MRPCKIGLISDTHAPMRWRDVPDVVFDIFKGVDLILHAGDVGELWVLDKLSTLAPVVAVHGNDDSADSIHELPYKQVVTIGGQRILLWHSHIQDRPTELAFRTIDAWQPKLTRLARAAKSAGASIVVYGHTHVAMTAVVDNVLVVNPGAIASGNMFTRQLNQSVAIMTLSDADPSVEHVNLDRPDGVWEPPFDVDAGFEALFNITEGLIISAELEPIVMQMRRANFRDWHSVNAMLRPLSFAVWEGHATSITKAQVIEALANTTTLDPSDHHALNTIFQS